jgi:hypothetical protein
MSSAAVTDNISAVSDGTNVHLLFVDAVDAAEDQVSYMKWNGSSWGSAVLVSGGADDDDAYVSLSLDTNNSVLYALWIDTNAAAHDIFFTKCTISTGCDAASEWLISEGVEETNWKNTGTNTNVTSNYSSNSISAIWTEGSVSPFTVNSGVLLVPELMFLFLGAAPLIPLLLKRKKAKNIYVIEHPRKNIN